MSGARKRAPGENPRSKSLRRNTQGAPPVAAKPYGPADLAAALDVSRETRERLESYIVLLAKWNGVINLVGKLTLEDVWRRHVLDSAQLAPLIPPGAAVLDIGSGAGFPGLVLAILGHNVVMVEQDQRKAAFLREAGRIAGCAVTVHAKPLSRVDPYPAALITARAFAPLSVLLDMAAPFIADETVALLLKGRDVEHELTAAAARWTMQATQSPSLSDPSGIVLRLEAIQRRSAVKPTS